MRPPLYWAVAWLPNKYMHPSLSGGSSNSKNNSIRKSHFPGLGGLHDPKLEQLQAWMSWNLKGLVVQPGCSGPKRLRNSARCPVCPPLFPSAHIPQRSHRIIGSASVTVTAWAFNGQCLLTVTVAQASSWRVSRVKTARASACLHSGSQLQAWVPQNF